MSSRLTMIGLTQEIYDSVIKINNADYANTAFYNIPGTKYTWSQVAMGYLLPIDSSFTQQILYW